MEFEQSQGQEFYPSCFNSRVSFVRIFFMVLFVLSINVEFPGDLAEVMEEISLGTLFNCMEEGNPKQGMI